MFRVLLACFAFAILPLAAACSRSRQAPPSEFVVVACQYFALQQFQGDGPVQLTHLVCSYPPKFNEYVPPPEELSEGVTYIQVQAAGQYTENCVHLRPFPESPLVQTFKKGQEETVPSFYLRFCRYQDRWICYYTSPVGMAGPTQLEYDGRTFYHAGPASPAKPFDPSKDIQKLALEYK